MRHPTLRSITPGIDALEPGHPLGARQSDRDDLASARGILFAITAGIMLWSCIGLFAYMLYRVIAG